MRTRLACSLLLFGLAGSAELSPAQAGSSLEREAPECISVRGEPRFQGYGQTHVVIVKSACERTVRCEVYTDVDPSPRYTLVVAPGKTEEIATRQGSPSSAFKAGYRCIYD